MSLGRPRGTRTISPFLKEFVTMSALLKSKQLELEK